MTIKSNIKSKEKFAFWFAISFILNGYSSGIPGISLGSVVFVLYTFIALFRSMKDFSRIKWFPLLLCIYFIILSLVAILFLNYEYMALSDMLFNTIKLLLWGLMITITVFINFDYNLIYKWLNRIAILLTVYIFIQTICFYLFSIYLPNIFNFWFIKPYAEGYADYAALSSSTILRPGSLLSESSFYGNYILCTLIMCFGKIKNKESSRNLYKLVLFYSLGIVVSTSTSAIVMLVLVWLIFFRQLPKIFKLIFYLLCLLLVVYTLANGVDFSFLINSGDFGYSLYYALSKFKMIGTSSRIGRSFSFLDSMQAYQKIWGVGIGNSTQYLQRVLSIDALYINSITEIIIEFGYLGIIGFIIFIIKILKKCAFYKDKVAFSLLCIYFIKGFASGIYFSTYGVLFMCLIFCRLYYFDKKRIM